MEIIEEENLVIFTVDDLLVHWKQERNHLHEMDKVALDKECGLKRLDGSWTKFVITDKKKLMLFCIKYGI